MLQNDRPPAALLQLPDELLHQILSLLDVTSVKYISAACRRLHAIASDNSIWASLIRSCLHAPLTTCRPKDSYRALYAAHEPYWFIPQRKIWFADTWPYGKLLVARYDERRGCIEAYTLVAEAGEQHHVTLPWLDGKLVSCFNFRPEVSLDLNKPLVSLTLERHTEINARGGEVPRHQKEIVMTGGASSAPDAPNSSFMLTHVLPHSLLDSRTKFWPPLTLPSPRGQRTRNDSASSFVQPGSKPRTAAEASDATFRVRQWIHFGRFHGAVQGGMNTAQQVRTFATLPAECYTPTAEKPWQGIWVGDYSSHGCEFLLVTQPDEPKAMPLRARRAYAAWPRSTVTVEQGRLVSALAEGDSDSEELSDSDASQASTPSSSAVSSGASSGASPGASSGASARVGGLDTERALSMLDDDNSTANSPAAGPADEPAQPKSPYRGRIEAIKLTGDPNVPRGEYTFIAPDISDAAVVGHLDHPLLADPNSRLGMGGSEASAAGGATATKGVRVVKSIGHVADNGSRSGFYIPSQLVMVSENRLAQYWLQWGHLAFFERVDLDAFVRCDV